MKQILSVIAILVLSAAAADAQTCMGGTELSRGSHRLNVGGTLADGTNGAGAGYGFGSDRFFGSAGIGFNRYDVPELFGGDQTQFAINTLFGTQIRPAANAALAICPIGQYDMGFGPNIDPVSTRTHNLAFGGRVGFATGDADRFNWVPTVGLSIVRAGVSVSNDLVPDLDQTVWDSYGLAHLGVGLRFNRSRMSLVPGVNIPMGLDGADPSFGVTFSSSF
jgi:hypothetical protein